MTSSIPGAGFFLSSLLNTPNSLSHKLCWVNGAFWTKNDQQNPHEIWHKEKPAISIGNYTPLASVKILTTFQNYNSSFFSTWCTSVWPSRLSATKFLFFEGEKKTSGRGWQHFSWGGETCFIILRGGTSNVFLCSRQSLGKWNPIRRSHILQMGGWLHQVAAFFLGGEINWINQWNH